jgi:cell division protein FtsZ
VIDKQMEGQMRVTVIATGFEDIEPIAQQERPALRKVVGGSPFTESGSDSTPYKHLKSLASSIKEENPDAASLTANFDIPTFLRKHAD